MSECVYLVVGRSEDDAAAAAFDEWFPVNQQVLLHEHGFDALRCFRMRADVGGIPPITYTHLAVFTCHDRRPVDESLLRRTDSGARGRIASFYGDALEEPIDLARLDHVYVVFTRPPHDVPVPDFFDWYATHMRENLTAEGFDAAWRFRIEPDIVDPLAPSVAVHAALYEVHGALPELRASLDRAEQEGRVVFPDWFPRMQLACLDAHAISGAVAGR